MTDLDKQAIHEAVKEAVAEHLASYDSHSCPVGITCPLAEEMGGVGEMKANHAWMSAQRKRADKIASAFTIALATSVVAGLCAVVWAGIKQLVTK